MSAVVTATCPQHGLIGHYESYQDAHHYSKVHTDIRDCYAHVWVQFR